MASSRFVLYERFCSLLELADDAGDCMRGATVSSDGSRVLEITSGTRVSEQEFNALPAHSVLAEGFVHCGALHGDAKVRLLQQQAISALVNDMVLCGWLKSERVIVGLSDLSVKGPQPWSLLVWNGVRL